MKNNVKQLRLQKEWSQSDLATAIGVSRQTIYAIEIGKYIPSVVIALKLAAVFGKPVESFFELETTD
jgi:putative transcriptional regulator